MLTSLLLTVVLGQVAPAPAPATVAPPPKAMTLVIDGDALTLAVVTAAEKDFAYRARPAPLVPASHRVQLTGADGQALASVPLDLSGHCLLLDHLGDPPHVLGDTLLEHRVLRLVKVPLVEGLHQLRFERRVGVLPDGSARWELVGLTERPALERLLASSRRLQQQKGR